MLKQKKFLNLALTNKNRHVSEHFFDISLLIVQVKFWIFRFLLISGLF